MDYRLEELGQFTVVGLQVRTTNENMQAAEDIPKIWERFYQNRLQDLIPSRSNQDILGLYTDYESDYTAPYTFVACCQVDGVENVPEATVGKAIAASKYAVFTATGKCPDCLLAIWQQIWQSDLHRSYSADFEVYSHDFNPEGAKIEVWISVA